MADRGQYLDDFCVRWTLVMGSVHVVHLRSGAWRFELLTLPTGGEAGGLTKEGRIFLKNSGHQSGSRSHTLLEEIGILDGELFLCFLEAGKECGALDPDNLGNCLIGQTVLT